MNLGIAVTLDTGLPAELQAHLAGGQDVADVAVRVVDVGVGRTVAQDRPEVGRRSPAAHVVPAAARRLVGGEPVGGQVADVVVQVVGAVAHARGHDEVVGVVVAVLVPAAPGGEGARGAGALGPDRLDVPLDLPDVDEVLGERPEVGALRLFALVMPGGRGGRGSGGGGRGGRRLGGRTAGLSGPAAGERLVGGLILGCLRGGGLGGLGSLGGGRLRGIRGGGLVDRSSGGGEILRGGVLRRGVLVLLVLTLLVLTLLVLVLALLVLTLLVLVLVLVLPCWSWVCCR